MVALGVGPGDEVIVPDLTFPATANVVVQQGAVPVLVDIDPDTFNMDPDELAGAMTARTRAVIVVHAFGLCADMDAVLAVTEPAGVPVVEDAACALGGTYKGRPAGALSRLGCFSFHPRKIITTGEGGMITTEDDALASRIAVLRTHGGVRGELYLSFDEAGFNYRLSDVNAAIGVAQMSRLEDLVRRRREHAGRLAALLRDCPGIKLPSEPKGTEHTYQSFVVQLDASLDRDGVIRQMRDRGVETTLGTYSLHCQPYFQRTLGVREGQFKNGFRAFHQSLTLPLYPQLTNEDLARTAEALEASIAAVS
jgi:dTDP-4-amino-4,6-dideoxygalactose transaminase